MLVPREKSSPCQFRAFWRRKHRQGEKFGGSRGPTNISTGGIGPSPILIPGASITFGTASAPVSMPAARNALRSDCTSASFWPKIRIPQKILWAYVRGSGWSIQRGLPAAAFTCLKIPSIWATRNRHSSSFAGYDNTTCPPGPPASRATKAVACSFDTTRHLAACWTLRRKRAGLRRLRFGLGGLLLQHQSLVLQGYRALFRLLHISLRGRDLRVGRIAFG